MPRPEGRRCLVISSQHTTISRHRNGSILHKFSSTLPNGSRESAAGSGDDFCILDCVFHEPDSVYYVLDMMCWKGYALYDCSAEFRLFWVQSKLAECMPGPGQEQQRYHFVPVPAFACSQGESQSLNLTAAPRPPPPTPIPVLLPSVLFVIWGQMGFNTVVSMPSFCVLRCLLHAVIFLLPTVTMLCDAEGLHHTYSSTVPFQRDGLYFLHKEGHYSLGTTPLAVLWKDEACSQYVIDTDANGVVPEHQVCGMQCYSQCNPLLLKALHVKNTAYTHLVCIVQSVTLEYRMDQTVATADNPPVVLGRMPAHFVQTMAAALRHVALQHVI